MRTSLLITGSVRQLRRNAWRTLFMGFGIVVGVAALVVMRSMGLSTEQSMMKKIDKMLSGSTVIIVNGAGAMKGGKVKPGKLTMQDVGFLAAEMDQIVDWDASIYSRDRSVQYGGKSREVPVVGHTERAEVVWNRGVIRGEFFSNSDVRSASRVALLGTKLAEDLFDGEDPIGQTIRIEGAPYRVKGILQESGFDPHGMDRDNEAHVPVTAIQRRMINTDKVATAKLLLRQGGDMDRIVEDIADLLVQRHAIPPTEPEDFTIVTPTQVQHSVKEAHRSFTIYLPATAGISLVVAGIVIANLMLLSVRERTPEIGLRKAVGATNGQIAGQFLLESLAVTLVSGLVGAGAGFTIVTLMAASTRQETGLAADSIPLGLAAALITGTLAGYLPARRAAAREPVESLR